jgi:heterotetrameric sarcosine oxidase gamma subunit
VSGSTHPVAEQPLAASTIAFISELSAPRQLVSVIARRGQSPAVAALVQQHCHLELPMQPRAVFADSLGFLWCGPGHWLAMADATANMAIGLEAWLGERLAGCASVCDQSGSRVMFSVQGPAARAVLAKGLAVDLHPRSFEPGHVALSSIAHMGVQLWQVNALPEYRLLVARSYAENFRHWLQAANNGY